MAEYRIFKQARQHDPAFDRNAGRRTKCGKVRHGRIQARIKGGGGAGIIAPGRRN